MEETIIYMRDLADRLTEVPVSYGIDELDPDILESIASKLEERSENQPGKRAMDIDGSPILILSLEEAKVLHLIFDEISMTSFCPNPLGEKISRFLEEVMKINMTNELAEAVIDANACCARVGLDPDCADWQNLLECSRLMCPDYPKETK
jgi:hypothetical protein